MEESPRGERFCAAEVQRPGFAYQSGLGRSEKVWPKSIEAQGMSDSMGDIWNIDQFPMKVDPARTRGRHTVKVNPSNEKHIGQWNDYEVYLNGGNLRIYVNRLIQNFASEVEEVPGKICLQSEGSPKEFRNIVLIRITR